MWLVLFIIKGYSIINYVSFYNMQELLTIIDKLVELQSNTTEQLTILKEQSKETKDLLVKMDKHFSNGFRQEIKDHISAENKNSVQLIENLIKINGDLNNILSKPYFWLKLILGTIVTSATAITALIVLINHFVK